MGDFVYRGFMLDCARHMMPVEAILRILDGAAQCGMNRMHWHLTDDQGWRLEIRRFPRLTQAGARRGPSFFGALNENENNEGFYTQEEVRRVVAHARAMGIEIVPEIEVPGHASAMLAAYPEYGCRREAVRDGRLEMEDKPYDYQVGTLAGIFPNLICAGREEAEDFLFAVLDEVAELFPGPEVHIGGDEAIKMHWRRCPDCQRRMREKGLKDEHALQRDLVLRVGAHLSALGKKVIVWNESLEGGGLPADTFIVQHWMGNDRETAEFMAAGGKVIVSDNRYYYLNRPYRDIDIRTLFEAPDVPDYASGHPEGIWGFEAPMWSERVTNPSRAEFLLFPRLAAVGMKAAGDSACGDRGLFFSRVAEASRRIDACGVHGAPEGYWDQSAEGALREEDLQARFRDTEDMKRTWRICDGLLAQEKLEKLLSKIRMPRLFALRVMDTAWHSQVPEFSGRAPQEADDGAAIMAAQLLEALENREKGAWKGVEEEIWLDTMACYTRFVNEHMKCTGHYGFDRHWWTVRQAGARLFRVGELEYELFEEGGERYISLHIPSDAKLEPDALNDSVSRARAFLRRHFPDWAELPIRCMSWLLSPVLPQLLGEGSRIVRFQKAFDITSGSEEENEAVFWVFWRKEARVKAEGLASLPEETTLQRRLKRRLMEGGKAGEGAGTLARPFT